MIDFESRKRFAAEYLCGVLKLAAPKDTGNLAANGIRILDKANGVYDIGIGGEPAPYATYTNEPWISPKWGGKKNPNEGWIQNAIQTALPMLQRILDGAISEDDLVKEIDSQNKAFGDQLVKLWERKVTERRYQRLLERYERR